ncbi:MAG: hypothetical protein J6A01_04100 [Proteobacteria bacterium]|nr:hypothetical protein [Pseudomonadota bacterium]
MKKMIVACALTLLCLGCLDIEDLDTVKLGTFSDSYRQANWTDEEYQTYKEWFDQLLDTKIEDRILNNMNGLQPYLQYGLINVAASNKVNFDKQVVFIVKEGLVPAKEISIALDYGGVVSYSMTYDKTSPACCKDNCPPENANLKDTYFSVYAVDKAMTEHLLLKGTDKCE